MSGDEHENVAARRTPLDYLVFATWILLMLSIGLGAIVLTYCLFFFPDHSPCPAHRFAHSTLLFLVIAAIGSLFIRAKQQAETQVETSLGYWEREENVALYWKINNLLWHLFPCVVILYYSIILMQHMSVEHQHFLLTCTPSLVERFLPLIGWLLIAILLNHLTLFVVKRCRERDAMKQQDKEPQV